METAIYSRASRYELFTETECVQILNKFLAEQNKKGKLLNFNVEADLSSVGFLGEYYNLYLRYEDENGDVAEPETTRFFVKSTPYQNADMTNYIHKSGMLKKETALYGTLLNELKTYSKHVWCTRCYLARDDLFVMQHIIDLGYMNIEKESGFLQEPHIRAILKGLATMHASSIAYELKHKVNIGTELSNVLVEFTVDRSVVWYTAGIEAVLAVALEHPKYKNNAETLTYLRDELPKRLDTIYDMVNPSVNYRNVFCHRDVWGGNVFFHKTQPFDYGCIFVDFQLCRYAPPAIDVLMALYLNVRPQERRLLMERCCQYYYDCFANELTSMGVDAESELSRAEFMKSMREFELFGATYNCLAATILRLPDNYLKDLKETNPKEFHRYTNVERKDQLLELVSSNADFREYMFECIEDMLNVVL